MSFVFAPAATYMVSLSRKNCNNIKNHLTILRLNFLRSNLKSNLQILFAETRTPKMLKFKAFAQRNPNGNIKFN